MLSVSNMRQREIVIETEKTEFYSFIAHYHRYIKSTITVIMTKTIHNKTNEHYYCYYCFMDKKCQSRIEL